MSKAINGVLVAKDAGNAVFYIFKNGLCTEEIPLNTEEMVDLANALGNNLAKANIRSKNWKTIAVLACFATGYLLARNHDLKKEVQLCKDEIELEKEMNHTDTL